MTADQRKAAITKAQTDLTTWAKAQGIDPSYVLMGGGDRAGRPANGAPGRRPTITQSPSNQ